MANTNESKRVPVISAEIDDTHDQLTLTCINSQKLTVEVGKLSSGIVRYATMHGLKQKLVDAAAIVRNPETGKAATPDDKWSAVVAVFDRLMAGQWNATREGGATGGLLARALMRLYGKDAEFIQAFLAKKSDAEKTALRKNPKVADMIETIRAETGKASSVDTDALLSELED